MARKYKNAKTSYSKLNDDKKIDFLLSKIDDITSHADILVSAMDNNEELIDSDKSKTAIEKLKRGVIKISYSSKRIWNEHVVIDKLFKGNNPVFEKELVNLYSQSIVLKQTKNAPEVFSDEQNIIYVNFPKGISNTNEVISRMFLDKYIEKYFKSISETLRMDWSLETKKKIIWNFVKQSNLMFIQKETKEDEVKEVLNEVLGFHFYVWFNNSSKLTWERILSRILQIGAMAKTKENLGDIEKEALKTLVSLESKMLTKLNNRI